MKRVAVLASGRGTNLGALISAANNFQSYRVVLVISNVRACDALGLAATAGVEGLTVPSRGLVREDHERAVQEMLATRAIDVICLAGYMRVLTGAFIEAFAKPILNVHPSLLPSFPGLNAQRQAIEAGVRFSGVTVHLVDAGLDTGPILLQQPVRVEADDTEETLSKRILSVEHELFPQACDVVSRNAYEIRGRRVYLLRR